jgi:ACT domain-containing protein
MTDTPTDRVRAACEHLLTNGHEVTFTAVAHTSGISRATCYRNRDLRTIIDTYRARDGDLLTLTHLADRVDQLAAALEAVAAKVRRQEEEIRALHRRQTPAPTQPTRTQNPD